METSQSNSQSNMLGHAHEDEELPIPPLLEHDCSEWMTSSQHMEDLYVSGAKLWRRSDLIDIEQQLSHFRAIEKFIIRCVDGSIVYIKNPMYGVQRPIWFPTVKFQEYWRLVNKPEGFPETYRCSYLVDWENRSARDSRGLIEDPMHLFLENKQTWNRSMTFRSFQSLIYKFLFEHRITKIICFGLGDISLKMPEWWREQHGTTWQMLETNAIQGRMMRYWAVLSIASMIRSSTGNRVRILTQDPDYVDETKKVLRKVGFEVVGQFGAGGFAELDDETVVFTGIANAPIKQIIADIARPALIIALGEGKTFNATDELYGDPESPRTKRMWREYESWDFPVEPTEANYMGEMDKLKIHARNATRITIDDLFSE